MRQSTQPIIYHPSDILLVEADKKIRELVVASLGDNFTFITKNNPREALEYLSSHILHSSDLVNLIAHQTFDFPNTDKASLKHDRYTININSLKDDLGSTDRFKKVFVVVVDRHMPGMDGLEFCRLIRQELNMPVKLILLTEDVNLDEIISAAADGEIDAFIEKRSGLQMIHRLNQVIQKLTWQHLCEISEQIIRLIEPQLSHVFDEKFDEEFEKIRQENHTSEFYLFDTSGSFLLIDQHGEAKLFFVRKADEFKSMHDFAKESGAMQDVLQGLTNRQHFPFTVSEAGHLTVQGEQWKNIMIPMRKIADRDVFYSVVNLADLNIRGYEYYHEQLQECV